MSDIDTDRNSKFYDAAWAEWNDMIVYSPAPRLRRTRILSWLKDSDCNSLLDVGCGNAEFLLQAHRTFPALRMAGADISPAVIETNRTKIPDTEFFVFNLDSDTLTRRYDAVTCMEVIEHCADYRAAIRRLADMTEQKLFITVPCGPLFEIDRRVGHTRHFSAHEIGAALQDAGLRVKRLECWGFPFFNLYKYAINISPDSMCKSFLSSNGYSLKQKLLASATYLAFKMSLPFGGYQLFAVAER
jgi:SAM-dependent methyltransferase